MAEKHLFKRHPLSLAVANPIFRKVLLLSLCVTGTQALADPFFSEYVEGASNSKALEIYNPGPGSLNLASCQVKMYFNGAITPGLTHTFTSGTIPAGGVYVLANPISSTALLNLANGVTLGTAWFNGDDAIELTCGGVTKDIIGQIGLDPGSEWGTGLASTQDNTISRKSTVCAGDTNGANAFDPAAEWTGSAIDTFSGLGSHTASCALGTPTVNLSVSATAGTEAGQTAITVTATASAAVSGDQTVNLAVSGTGITSTDYALSNATITIPNGNTSGSVTFTITDDTDIEGAETATLTISSPTTGISLGTTTTQAIAITDNDAPVLPSLTINDVSQSEGNNGTQSYVFTVSLSAPAGAGGVSFDIATTDGTATNAAGDYISKALVGQTIAAGNSSYTFSVVVNGDQNFEANETFTVNVSQVSGATLADGQALATITNDDNGCGSSATKISALQGNGTSSPLTGVVGTTIEGIVVGDYQGTNTNSLRGYFVQEEDADVDGNAATSEGIFVFEGTTPITAVSVGDRVRVTGTPAEFFNMTQLGTVTSAFVCANNQAMPAAVALTLPVPGVPSGNLTTATTAINAYFEKYEGMLVSFPATLSVSEYFQLERYGQLTLSQGGRIPTFSSVTNPGVAAYTNHLITLAKRQIILDDGNNTQNFALSSGLPLPYPSGGLSTSNRFRGGDTINNLTGVLHWSFAGQSGTDAWRVRPVEEVFDYNFISANPRKPTAPQVGGTLKVASFNVLNYFTTIDTTSSSTSGPCSPSATQDCRGADSADELARQTAKAAAALCGINADIVGLMEIENNTTDSLTSLVNATNATSGCGPYAYINTGTIGGDAIKVALLYKTATVSPVGSHALLTTAEDIRFIDTKNRPSLAQTFTETATGEKFTVAVNHLKSKGSDCIDVADPDALDGQGNCNLTRKNAAMALTDWLNSDPTSSGDPDFLIIGDLNSYAKEDPIKAIESGPDDTANTVDDYTNLVKNFGGTGAYSYVFDGQTGYLDHALANKTLASQVTDTADWHINSDEPPSFDYNDTVATTGEASFEVKPAALLLYEANQYRTSDHDPVIIGLKLGESINTINGTTAKNTLVGTPGKDRITGLGAADLISGGLGNDEFVYTTPTEGIDTISDFTLGQDKIILTALLQSLQYQGLDPIADGVVSFEASGSTTSIYIDSDGTAGPAVKRALIVVRNISVANLKNSANFLF
ncbi:MAG: ExeM/NucH family extracellular endonuclease [Methylococcales bacterium]|nr:ExeM/NucH family extracellular endonuclease [Methylococcales bacterium]